MGGQVKPAPFEEWLYSHPREALQLLTLCVVTLWQFPVALLGFILFLILIRWQRMAWWWVLGFGLLLSILNVSFMEYDHHFSIPLSSILSEGASVNWQLFKLLIHGNLGLALKFFYDASLDYVVSYACLIAGILSVLELIPNSRYELALRALQKGKKPPPTKYQNTNRLESKLSTLDESAYQCTLLGISKLTQKPVVIPDTHINQMLLVLGKTGGGKTVTLRRFYQRALREGYPLIIVDGKPTDENVYWVMGLANRYNRPAYGFNCGTFQSYDCLAQGGYTELKDKIISLKDQWESDYYRSIAEDYLQTTFEVLLKGQESFDLKTVVECLDYDALAVRVRSLNDEKITNRVRRLENYDRKDITGLQAHLNLLIHSELGQYFERTERTFSLTDVIQNRGIVYFALPALRFPRFSKVLGKLVINDIKAVVDRVDHPRIFTVSDEFSVFAGEQVLNLVNMGRGKGVHAIFGTQSIADLQKVEKSFANQVLNCVNTIICHRLNDQDSAEAISSWVGTHDSFDLTAQISSEQGSTGMGSVRRNREFIVHPDAIKQELQPGEAFYITKVGQFKQDKVKVKYS